MNGNEITVTRNDYIVIDKENGSVRYVTKEYFSTYYAILKDENEEEN